MNEEEGAELTQLTRDLMQIYFDAEFEASYQSPILTLKDRELAKERMQKYTHSQMEAFDVYNEYDNIYNLVCLCCIPLEKDIIVNTFRETCKEFFRLKMNLEDFTALYRQTKVRLKEAQLPKRKVDY